MAFPFPLPPVSSSPENPAWTGRGFRVAGQMEPVLSYAINDSGWTDELTDFHESSAGEAHYIDIASRRNALSRLRQWVKGERPVIMDIGCSSGFMLRDIREAFPQAQVLGADYVVGPLRKLALEHPDWPLIQFDLTTCPLPDECLDAAVLLNVFEHIGEDGLAMGQLHRMLKRGGVAVIEVPAGPALFDIYDKQLMHFRRYDLEGLSSLLSSAGFEVHDGSHIGFFLYPAFAFTKRQNQKYFDLPDDEQLKIVEDNINLARSNPIMNFIMKAEEALRYRIPFPVGIRCVAVARKK
jgi:SAM-dependent methyltransferase